MKTLWVNARLQWSYFRICVGGFTRREQIIAVLILTLVFAGSYLACWGYNHQQGVWMDDLFFRKVSDNQYQASAARYPEIGSVVTVTLEDHGGYRVSWDGYEWYGRYDNLQMVDIQGATIPPEQMPFWRKIPEMYQDGEYFFMAKLMSMRNNHLEPLGYSNVPVSMFILALFLVCFLFPAVSRYPHQLDADGRQRIRFSSFVFIVLIVLFQVGHDAYCIFSNWV